jgi:hypothetical protein
MASNLGYGVVHLGWHPGIAWMLWWPVVATLEPQRMAQLDVCRGVLVEYCVVKP